MKIFAYGILLAGFIALSSAFGGTWGCSSGGGGGGGTATTSTYEGTVALNDGTVGTLTVTVQSAVASTSHFSLIREANAQTSGTGTASCTCVTPTCTLTSSSGTYDPSTGAVSISATGGTGSGCSSTTTTTFTGTVTPPASGGSGGGGMSGSISTTPTSGGTPTPIGGFSGVFTPATGSAVSYCGIAVGGDTDAINVSVAPDGTLTGTAQPIDGSGSKSVSFSGTVTGTTFGACGKEDGDTGPSHPICGVIGSDGSVNGRFQRKEGGEGCFTGSTNVCTTGTLPAPCPGPTAVCTYPTCS